MPNTADHKAAMHRLARKRVADGKPVWDRKISFADVWRNEDMTFEQRRDAIVARIRASDWFTECGENDELPQLVEELSEVADVVSFDAVWDAIYDVANADRVWIETR